MVPTHAYVEHATSPSRVLVVQLASWCKRGSGYCLACTLLREYRSGMTQYLSRATGCPMASPTLLRRPVHLQLEQLARRERLRWVMHNLGRRPWRSERGCVPGRLLPVCGMVTEGPQQRNAASQASSSWGRRRRAWSLSAWLRSERGCAPGRLLPDCGRVTEGPQQRGVASHASGLWSRRH